MLAVIKQRTINICVLNNYDAKEVVALEMMMQRFAAENTMLHSTDANLFFHDERTISQSQYEDESDCR